MPRNSQLTRSLLHAVNIDYAPQRFTVYTALDLDRIEQLEQLSKSLRFEMKVVSSILPFRVN